MGAADRLYCPGEEELQRFMRNELVRSEVTSLVRHLLTECPRCLETTRRLWGPRRSATCIEGTAAGDVRLGDRSPQAHPRASLLLRREKGRDRS